MFFRLGCSEKFFARECEFCKTFEEVLQPTVIELAGIKQIYPSLMLIALFGSFARETSNDKASTTFWLLLLDI